MTPDAGPDSNEVAAATAVTSAAADPDLAEPARQHARSSHGSPGDAPGHHHPGPPTHSSGTGHSPGALPGAAGADRHDRPAGAGVAEVRRPGRSGREDAAERSLRSLVTTRTTQVTPGAALRAREVALPSAADLDLAQDELVLVRRHYVPPTALTSGRRQDWPNRRGGQSKSAGTSQ
jgi:hypothetical protein